MVCKTDAHSAFGIFFLLFISFWWIDALFKCTMSLSYMEREIRIQRIFRYWCSATPPAHKYLFFCWFVMHGFFCVALFCFISLHHFQRSIGWCYSDVHFILMWFSRNFLSSHFWNHEQSQFIQIIDSSIHSFVPFHSFDWFFPIWLKIIPFGTICSWFICMSTVESRTLFICSSC